MAKRKRSPLPLWTTVNTHMELFHGCTYLNALRIRTGVNPTAGKARTDFGRGFYTTTRYDQAEQWAKRQFDEATLGGIGSGGLNAPAIVRFNVPLDALAPLETMLFVRGDPPHLAFWSFVTHCRAGNSHAHPSRSAPNGWYDVVCGPVADLPLTRRHVIGRWDGKDFSGYDQISFHTPIAAGVLNGLDRSNPAEFEIIRLAP